MPVLRAAAGQPGARKAMRGPTGIVRPWGSAAGGGISGRDSRLAVLIEEAVTRAGPTREVELEIGGGVFDSGAALQMGPFSNMRLLLDVNEAVLGDFERLVFVRVRNTGFTDVSVESLRLMCTVEVPGRPGKGAAVSVLGMNDFPNVNPRLPARIPAGDPPVEWLTKLATIGSLQEGAGERGSFNDLFAEVHLGSGEILETDHVAWSDLPFHAQ